MDTMLQDIRFALRMLRKSPWFTITAVVTLGLGIGANAAIFTVANTLLFTPPPHVQNPERTVAVFTSDFSGPRFGSSSWADYLDFRRLSADVLSAVATYESRPFAVATGGEMHRTYGEIVSGNYFDLLGVRPALGRFFVPAEGTVAGAPSVAVIGYGMWQRVFGGDSSVLGRAIRLNGQPVTVIGVAPRQFNGSLRGIGAELWTSMVLSGKLGGGSDELTSRGYRGLMVIGRLAPGATVQTAQARFNVIANQMHESYGDQWSDVKQHGRVLTVLSERANRIPPQMKGPVIGFVGMLMGVVALVLLICCANVANLLLARAAGREREIAVRLALGAKRSRLIRLLLTESVLLAALGGIAGFAVAAWATGLLMGFQPPVPFPVALNLVPDVRVLGFTLVVTLLTGAVFGLMPARRATRVDLVPSLKGGSGSIGRRRARLRDALVVGQVAVSMVLLVMSGLFLRSLGEAQSVSPGFDPKGLVLMSTDLSMQGYDSTRVNQFYGTLEERTRALPGVRGVAFAQSVPLSTGTERRGVSVEGYQPQQGEDLEFGANSVSADYFKTMGIPLLKGREFATSDRDGAPLVAVVNEAFARRFWPGQDAVGKRIGREGAWRTVVGVATTGKYNSLGEDPKPYFYVPLAQRPGADLILHVRASDPAATMRALRTLTKGLDADLPIQVMTMDEQLGLALLPQRIGATLLGIFGALGLVIAAIGLYGVLAFAVAQRTREIGVRIALGAAASDVRRLVVGHALTLAGVGAAIGLVLAFAAGRLASSFLFGVAPADPVTFIGVPLILGAVALLASWLPTRRAGRVDPMVALRSE